MPKKVYISGMHSGQNPCAGVGIAKSLRLAYPDLKIIGVDHWQGSSGLHHEAINEVLLLPQWKQIDQDRHKDFLRNLLDEGHLWISALDVEVYWLAQNFGSHPNLFAPTGEALERTSKPFVKAFNSLGFYIPDHVSAFLADAELHSFLRQNSWQCWLKGPYHDAKRISSWDSFDRQREAMQKDWKTKRLFLQKHMTGSEESICFSAYKGELKSAIHMKKHLITSEGKTWAGHVSPLDRNLFHQLSEVLKDLQWSGGGEIEYTLDPDGRKWIIECNPRFPAWIFGAALVGQNLPAQLVQGAWGIPFSETKRKFPGFTRVVQEIPANEQIGLPLPPDPSLAGWVMESQKGKGGGPSPASLMPKLRDSMAIEEAPDLVDEISFRNALPNEDVADPDHYADELKRKTYKYVGETPSRVHLKNWTLSRFQSLAKAIRESHPHPQIRIGYSLKTSSTDEHLQYAHSCGFLTECISQMEVHRAIRAGVPRSDIILNGPGKFWPLTQPPVTGLHMLFCDSIEEFDRVMKIRNMAKVLGFRIQLPRLQSRFGVPVDKIENFQGVVNCVRQIKNQAELGFHFHMPSWAIGVNRWKEAVRSLITWCQAVEQLTSVSVRHLDLGGGFFPSDLEKINFKWVQQVVSKSLPKVNSIYFEPGRALTQEGEAVVSRVLDIRRNFDKEVTEVVVDACIAELPMIHSFAHRVFYHPQQDSEVHNLFKLGKGKAKVLGRICMENDVLSNGLDIPGSIRIGDLVIFGDAGAYDRSMSYDFGRG